MNAPLSPQTSSDDLSALAWVQDELRRSLEAAHKGLRRFVKDAEALGESDVDTVDTAVLRAARTQIHQGVGALEMVGQPAVAMVLRASEAAVQRFVTKPAKLTTAVVDDIERTSFAVLDYLTRLLAGKPVSTLSLFPQYRAVQEAGGADRVHPADLWAHEWRWHDLPGDPSATPRVPDEATRGLLEAQLLPLMRAPDPRPVAARISDITAALGAGAAQPQVATLWKLAAAVFEAQAHGLLGFDVFSKRVASRLLAQFRILERGETEVSERLAQDLLFFGAQSAAPADARATPRLAAVRDAYGLASATPVDYSISVLGRFDPAVIAQARKRVTSAKDAWSGVAGGEMHRMTGLSEQFALVGESLKKLFPLGDTFAAELQQAVAQTQQSNREPPAPLAMEVATSLLYVEAALEDADFDHPDQAVRVQRLAQRLAAVRAGQPPEPLEAWMEDLYRRVSDRQTMGSVVQELRASLSESEKLIDTYFRNPADRQVLIPVPGQLSAMRGVLSVLGMDHACAALLRMRDEVDGLASTEIDSTREAHTSAFDHLASNLGALGFLIDMLSVQPQMAKSLFAFDAATGTLNPVMGRSEVHAPPISQPTVDQRLIDQAQALASSAAHGDMPVADVARSLERLSQEAQAADQPALAATARKAKEALDQADGPAGEAAARGALADFVSTASDPVGLAPAPAPAESERISRPMTLDFAPSTRSAQLAQDEEMLEIFLEEAREVMGNARTAHAELSNAPSDVALMTTLRRAFHTLKGSSRMVGLKDFGEAAWSGEQLFNAHLAEQGTAPTSLLDFTAWCLDYFSGWIDEIAAKAPVTHDTATVVAAAKVASAPVQQPEPTLESAAAPLVSVPAPLEPPAVPLALPPDLPSAADLELQPAPAAQAEPALPELSFDLDLAGLDATLAAAPAADELVSEHGELDMSTAELLDPFDIEATQPLPLEERPTPEPVPVDFELSLDLSEPQPQPEPEPVPAPLAELPTELPVPEVIAEAPVPAEAFAEAAEASAEEEHVKVVGPLRISIPLFNIYLNEADELSRRLTTELAEWSLELHRPIGEVPIALAHSLGGNSATVGFSDLSHLARLLEHAQARSQTIGHGTEDEARLFVDSSDEIRRLLHQFAAGFLKEPSPELLARLAEHEVSSARRLEAAAAAAEAPVVEEAPAIEPVVAVAAIAEPEPVVHEPVPELAALLHVPEPEPVSDIAPLSAPIPLVPDSSFVPSETHFDPLGVSELKPLGDVPVEPTARHGVADTGLVDADEAIDAIDAVDADLFPIFDEEAQELLPQLTSHLRDWARRPADATHPAACMRSLHTLKGGARLAGAMRLGEMAHRLEARIERLLAQPAVDAADIEALQAHGDALAQTLEALRTGAPLDAPIIHHEPAAAVPGTAAPAAPELAVLLESAPAEVVEPPAPIEPAVVAAVEPASATPPPSVAEPAAEVAAGPAVELPEIDWSRFPTTAPLAAAKPADQRATASQSAVRVRAPLLDRLVNQAGEVSITRSRIETGVGQIKSSLADLTENLERLRAQLRDIEFHGETQMTSRLEAAKAASQSFDPLEFDRFTRFQELTRMMAESVNDVATVQRTLQRSLEVTEDELVAQARMTRDLQDDLLRTRMVEFEGLSDRLYRVVRQAAKETGKSVRLDIVGGSIEVDRGVLDRMTGSFEHLLRNCVSHGIEAPEVRSAAGKDATGTIIVALSQEGNEVGVEFRDDGAGLNLARIRAKGEALGLIAPGAAATDGELANLIFTPGFSTAEQVTELAGRGVGMDVVRSEVNAMGGRVETATAAGQGTSFKLILPLTTAVTQVVMLRCGDTQVAVPSTLVEIVRRATPVELDEAYASASYTVGDRAVQFFWLGSLLQISARPAQDQASRTRPIVVIRSAQQRVALHVDEVLGNQEVVVKHLGPQLSRLPGLAGITLLASGEVALIYNPVALATLYGDAARAATLAALRSPEAAAAAPVVTSVPEIDEAPLVMVVDDSLTVRRVTQRLLQREGYRVVLAKDGLDALERLAEAIPAIVLSDIEMPRMDGFDLVRNMRADARLRDLPVIMITSRIAQKHRDYAAELGVDHYLGKPYSEEDLLALIARYTRRTAAATTVH